MDISRRTPGVERILAKAGQLAALERADHVTPLHLLHALLSEDSRGREILNVHGIKRESLFSETLEELEVEPGKEIPHHEQLRHVLHEAVLQSSRQGRYSELGSEHLLWGIAIVESDASVCLESQGLTWETLKAVIDLADGEPETLLSVDFELAEPKRPATDPTDVYRILDAASNRVREGIRVLEDALRFSEDAGFLTSGLKTWRHDFRKTLSAIDEESLLASRDTENDVGTIVSTTSEYQRRTIAEVTRANCKRVEEALRSLEEYGKIISVGFAEQISNLRYQFYSWEKMLAGVRRSHARLSERHLYLLVTRDGCHHDWETTLRVALNAGVDIVQLREKSLGDRELVELAHRAREITHEAGGLLIINDRPDIAALSGADGVHVGQEELTVRQVRRIVGPDLLVGVSTHSIEQARQAVIDGADYLGVGPVFPSATKSFEHLAGLEFVRQAADEISLPWFAIGGITLDNLGQVQDAGAKRIAVSHAVCGSKEPGEMVRNLKKKLS